MYDDPDLSEFKILAIAAAVYLLLGAAFFGPSRSGGGAKALFFLCFPFHAVAMPLLSAFGRGMGGLFQSKGFVVFLGVVALLAGLALGGDLCTASFMALLAIGFVKLGTSGLKEILGD